MPYVCLEISFEQFALLTANNFKHQVLIGGGQEAMNVTTTSMRQGKFETRFWHKIYEEEVGRVKGHFGPINTFVLFDFLMPGA